MDQIEPSANRHSHQPNLQKPRRLYGMHHMSEILRQGALRNLLQNLDPREPDEPQPTEPEDIKLAQ